MPVKPEVGLVVVSRCGHGSFDGGPPELIPDRCDAVVVQDPMLVLFKQSFAHLEQYKNNKEGLVQVLGAVRLIMRMFYSLNWQVGACSLVVDDVTLSLWL